MIKKGPTKKELAEVELARRIGIMSPVLAENISDLNTVQQLAVELIRGSENGLEFTDAPSFDAWFEDRFKPQLVWLTKEDYERALLRALWLARTFSATDYGSSRQRDMAQVWTDTARGFAGEIALSKFLQSRHGVETRADVTRGDTDNYLPTDVANVRSSGGEWRPPNLTLSVKATKFNGRWLDAPGAQINHSDGFVLAKLGITREHFLGFLRDGGFIATMLLHGKELEEISEADAKTLMEEIPSSHPIPVYLCGWLDKRQLTLPVHMMNAKVIGKKNIRIVVRQGVGVFTPDVVRQHPSISAIPGSINLRVDIEPIVESFTGQKFLAHSGAFKFGDKAWKDLIRQL